MEFDEVVLGRRSIRGYKQEPVPREVIEEVLELAVRAPSSMNTQPWHLYVVTGEVLDKIRKGNTERNVSGVPPSREIKTPNRGYEGLHRKNQPLLPERRNGYQAHQEPPVLPPSHLHTVLGSAYRVEFCP